MAVVPEMIEGQRIDLGVDMDIRGEFKRQGQDWARTNF
jgi:hypothetical protein